MCKTNTQLQCPACRSEKFTPVLKLDFGALYTCDLCGLGVRYPRSTADAMNALYRTAYYDNTRKLDFDQARMRVYARDLAAIGLQGKGRNILDFGCGLGHFLAYARGQGWAGTGIELSAQAAAAARERFGLDVRVGGEEAIGSCSQGFDAITVWNVLDQVPDPRFTLQSLYPALKPGGAILVRVFNLQARRHILRIGRLLGIASLVKDFGFFHEYAFTRKSIVRMMAACGYRDVRVRNSSIAGDGRKGRLLAAADIFVRMVCGAVFFASAGHALLSPSMLVIARK